MNNISIIRTFSQEEIGYIRTYLGIFSPTNKSYRLFLGKEWLPWLPEDIYPYRYYRSDYILKFDHQVIWDNDDNKIKIEGIRINKWTMKKFPLYGVASLDGTIRVSLTADELHIINNSKYPLKDCGLLIEKEFILIGDIPANRGSQKINIKKAKKLKNIITKDARKTILITELLKLVNDTQVIFFAWIDEPIIKLYLHKDKYQLRNLNLLLTPAIT